MKLPLTPIRFLLRAETYFASKTAVLDEEESWTYGQYAERCRRLANLLSRLDVAPGSRVAFLAFNTHQLLEAYYGVPLAGSIFLPLNIRLSSEELTFILNDAEADCLFFHRAFLPLLEEIRPKARTLRHYIPLDPGPASNWFPRSYDDLLDEQAPDLDFDYLTVNEDDVAEIFYTSGTTSRPKGVMLTHRNLYLHALEAGLVIKGQESDVHLHTIPLFHVNGWGTPQFLTGMGGTHVMIPKFDPQEVLNLIQRHGVTTFSVVPTMAAALLHSPRMSTADVSSVRLITIGGAASHPKLIREMEAAFDCPVYAGYGLTETSPVLTVAIPKSRLKLTDSERHQLQAMAGLPMMGLELRIIDGSGREVPWDGQSEGEVVVRGDMVMKGYWRQPEASQEALQDGWFHTGDMATVSPEGYVQIVDRKKDIIVSGGENISSIELENVLLRHPAVLECAVIPVPDENWGEVPKALVVLKTEGSASEEDLVGHCREHLAGFKVPKSIEFYPELPKGGTGKILKRQLREKYWQAESRRVH